MFSFPLAAVAVSSKAWALALMLCGETRGLEDLRGHRRADIERAVIVQVAMSRAHDAGTTIEHELALKGQWAKGDRCGASRLRRYAELAGRVLRGRVTLPAWARRARLFAAPTAARRVTRGWRRIGFVPVRRTHTLHVFFEPVRGRP